jgi:hypothetical protein
MGALEGFARPGAGANRVRGAPVREIFADRLKAGMPMNRIKRGKLRPGLHRFSIWIVGAFAAYGWITIVRALVLQLWH